MPLVSQIDALAVAVRAKLNAITTALNGKLAATHAETGGTAHAAATTSAAGFMAAADKTKLNGIATSATANDTDANLKNRANHTGSQAISTVTGLQTAIDGKLDATAQVLAVVIDAPGKPDSGARIVRLYMPASFSFTAANCKAGADVAATGSTVLSIRKTGAQIGTITFGAGSTIGTVAFSNAAVTALDEVTIHNASSADATLSGLTILLRK